MFSDSSICGSWFGTRCLKAVLSPVGTLAIVMCFVTLLSFSIYGCTTLTSVIEVDTVRLPRRSPEAAAAWNAQQTMFHEPNVVRPLVRIYSITPGADYFASMGALDALQTQLSLNTFILGGSIQFWWPVYLSYLANNAPYNIAANGLVTSGKPVSAAVMMASLRAFLNTAAGAQYWEDIVPLNVGATPDPANPLGGGLRAFRVGFRIVAASSSADEARAMDAMRGLTGGTTFSALPLFSYHPHYAALEGQKDLIWEVTRHLLISGATILLALLFLLANLWAAVAVALALAITVLELVGLLALSDLPVSPDSAMPCLVWLALSVGFFTHSTQGFLRCKGLRPYRAFKTMQKIGGCIVDYICVLFLSVLLLAAARTQALFVAFESLALLATLGVFNGLMVWPVFLAYLGPGTSFNAEITLTQIESNPVAEWRATVVAPGALAASRPGGTDVSVRDPANPFTGEENFQPRPVKPVQGVEMTQQTRQQNTQPSLYDHNTEPEIEPLKRGWNPHDPANQAMAQPQQQPSLRTPQKPAGKWM